MKTISSLVILAMLGLAVSSAFADATFRPGDTMELRIGGVPAEDQGTITSTYTVDGEGFLNLPLIGKIRAAQSTASAVQAAIERKYIGDGIFTHPTITLNVSPSARFVNVAGAVKSPQRVGYTADMTVLSAINAAGDFSDFADRSKVRLVRDGNGSLVNCKEAIKNPSKDVKVLPGDQITVPEGFW